jgi:hypothetical protein
VTGSEKIGDSGWPVQMEVRTALGSEMKALMNIRQQPETGQQGKQSFGRLKMDTIRSRL